MQARIICNNPGFIMYELIPGKPHPYDLCSKKALEGNDTRSRVVQKASESDCFLASLHTICDRIGHVYAPEFSRKRAHEQLCSKRRKELVAIFKKNQTLFRSDNPLFALDKAYMERLPNSLNTEINSIEEEQTARDFSRLLSYINAFISQIEHKDFGSFLIKNLSQIAKSFILQKEYSNFGEFIFNNYQDWEINKINEKFLNRIRLSMQFFTEESISNDPILHRIKCSTESTFEYLRDIDQNYRKKFANRSWNELTETDRYLLTARYLDYAIAKLYELKIASWTPFKPINILIKDLKERGPLKVSGRFHSGAYNKPYRKWGKINGHNVLLWPEGAKNEKPIHHGITIIGAKKRKI